jgi:hypothetical protein
MVHIQPFTWPPSTFQNLSHDGTKACIHVQKKSVAGVCNQDVTAFFKAAAANGLPATCFLRDSKRQKSLGMRLGL